MRLSRLLFTAGLVMRDKNSENRFHSEIVKLVLFNATATESEFCNGVPQLRGNQDDGLLLLLLLQTNR